MLHISMGGLTSGVTPADLLAASMAAESISSMYLQTGIGGTQNWELSCHRRMLFRLSYASSVVIREMWEKIIFPPKASKKNQRNVCTEIYIRCYTKLLNTPKNSSLNDSYFYFMNACFLIVPI